MIDQIFLRSFQQTEKKPTKNQQQQQNCQKLNKNRFKTSIKTKKVKSTVHSIENKRKNVMFCR